MATADTGASYLVQLRKPILVMVLSAAGLVGLVAREGYTDRAVVPVEGDVPTVGFGSTTREDNSPVRIGDTTTPVRALQRTLAYVQIAEANFKRCVHVPLTQGEFDLYLDFGYQYGMPTLCASAIVANLNALRYREACDGLLEYRFMTSATARDGWQVWKRDAAGRPTRWRFDCATAGNKVCMGVWTRQRARYERCLAEQG